jgi:pilus assembly protein FimV
MLVELSWSSGKLLREYTFLLDPPEFMAAQPKAEEVKPIEPILVEPAAVAAPVQPEPVIVEPALEPVIVEAEPVAEKEAPAEMAPPAEQAPTEQVQESAPADPAILTQDALSKEEAIAEEIPQEQESITVLRGDSLSKIAAKIKPADVSLERMLVALYRENAAEFDGHNMNRIRAGKILKMPKTDAIEMTPQADAEELIHVQAADWNVYRQKLAAARTAAAERADKQEAAGKIDTVVTDKAASDKEAAKEVLKLSKGEAPGDKAVGAGKATAQEKDVAKEEEAIAKAKALKEAQERTAILEKNVKDMQRLAELKKEAAAASAPAPAAVAAVAAASAPQAAKPEAELKPKPKPKVEAPKVVEQPSLMDQLLGDPLYMAGGAALLLLLGGAGFVAARRGGGKKKALPVAMSAEDEGSATGRITAPVVSSPDTGDFTQAATAPAPAAADAEEVDPIGEADLFLTFGRDAQAEEVLKEALSKNPNNIPVKLKLLSIYVSRKDTNSFYSYAREIKESGDESAWEQTAKMGRELEPSNPFYGGDGAAVPAGEAKAAEAPGVDFDLGFGAPAKATPSFGSQNTVVLDTPSQESTTVMSAESLRAAAQETPMDFDITGTNPGVTVVDSSQEVTSTLNMDDLVFDVTATHPKVPVPPAPAAAPAPADDGMTFTLDFPTDGQKTEAAPAALDIGLGDINLNLDNLGASSGATSADGKDEQWHEVATKLDLAKAYQEMGDGAGAREILEEVLRDGDEQQKEAAQTLMQQL